MAPLRRFATLCCFPAVLAFTGEDHSAWIQQQVSVHKDATPRRSPEKEKPAKKQPKAVGAHRVREKPTPKPKMSSEERSQGPITKKALNANLQTLLKAFNVPPLIRGTVSGKILDEVMSARKTMPASSRAFVDHVLTVDFSELSTASMYDRFEALAKGLHEAGWNHSAEFLDTMIPMTKVGKYMMKLNVTELDFKTVPPIIRDLVDLVPQMKPYRAYARDIANLMEGNYQKRLTADQVMKDFPMETNTETMQVLGDYIYFLRDIFMDRQGKAADVGQILRDIKLKPLGDFVQDMPSLKNAGLTELTQRTARLVDEAQLVNSSQLDNAFDGMEAYARGAALDREKNEELMDGVLQGIEDKANEAIRSFIDGINNSSKEAEEHLNNVTNEGAHMSKVLGNATKNVWNLAQNAATSTVATLHSTMKEAVVELRNVAKVVLSQLILIVRWGVCHIKTEVPAHQEQCSHLFEQYPTVSKLTENFVLPKIPVTLSMPSIIFENVATLWASVEEELEKNELTANLIPKLGMPMGDRGATAMEDQEEAGVAPRFDDASIRETIEKMEEELEYSKL